MNLPASPDALDAAALRLALSGPPEKVVPLLRTLAAGGAIEAQAMLGQMLLDHPARASSAAEALGWFGQAAKSGHVMAMNMVGRCAENGWGTRLDKARAAQWYLAAADRGLDWGMYNLATLLTLGDGVAKDLLAALTLFRRASALGHAKSTNMIGSFYEDGWAVPRDRKQAAHHYARAAEGSDFRGQFNTARLLLEDGSIDEALVWLARVAQTATPRFLEQMQEWLASQNDMRLRGFALDGYHRARYANNSH